MALSKSARLYLKISDSLSEEDVRNLRALVVHDRILGKSRVERATPLEIFNMLDDNMAIGEGNLGFLEQLLRSLGKGKLADEVRHLEQEQKKEGTSQSNGAETKKSVQSTDDQDTQISLNRLHVELNTLAVKPDKDHQDWDRMLDLYCQIGDLYRTKLHLLQSALKYYQKMLECSQALSKDTKEAEAYNRIGLTYEILGLHKEASTNHERALGILKAKGRETEVCAAYKTLASSLALSGQVSDAKTHYESALAAAMEARNKTEQLDINSKLGDLHREQLDEPRESHWYYTEMLALAKDLGREDLEGHAYNRLGLACGDMQDNKSALKWHRKDLTMSLDAGDKTAQIAAHTNVGNAYRLLGKHDKATSHFNSALQLAQQTGDLHGQMDVYMKMGEMHREQLHFPHTALQHYEQYLSLARQLMDRQQEGLAYNRLGLTHHEMGEYEEALKWYERALKMQEDDGDKAAQIVQHTNMGDTCRLLGQLDRARSHYQSAMAVAMETDNK
ncbi:PREDICTED: tetratricopeptide repeat protein 28-like [Branchiostoma belcheri]|uniref:Tetratricopeptide repeat protein 28-like n=1 Tax=Branchiostoma belcheri TaxID=7741 RepID=A0A6P5AYA5_BRABE|nr:PREDICTED: tetratricopeptide repeat protein 28-like [Branchiostoma belcheri]